MPIKYISYEPNLLHGQAVLDNLTRTRRTLRYRDSDKVHNRITRGLPLYEVETSEIVGNNPKNLVLRGECLAACAYLKANDIKIDLVYIDPPFASGADYAKKVYIRRNPQLAESIAKAEEQLDNDELRAFEEKMYGDKWNKEDYLNWMYENLTAIKSVMSDNASIYVHLDYHVGHYVKILMDEVFGEENFQNEIIWHYSGWNKKLSTSFEKRNDAIYVFAKNIDTVLFNSFFEPWDSKEDYIKKRKQQAHKDADGREYVLSDGGNGKRIKRYLDDAIKEGKVVDNVWHMDKVNNSALESTGYATQKPEALLQRIIKASSDKGMIVADFFGGSGVTAKVAHDLGRRFVHIDIGINSIQTVRDRLKASNAAFEILDVKDGVSLFRNPIQTMDKLKSLIIGLRNEDKLDKFWEGAINDSKLGLVPIYLPNLLDHNTKVLDVPMMNRILHEAMPDLPENTRQVVIYYIDIAGESEILKYIDEHNNTMIKIVLRDLKTILDEVVLNDIVEYELKSEENNYEITITKLVSDRLLQKIDEYNQKKGLNKNDFKNIDETAKAIESQQNNENTVKTGFKPITISENGLELVELIALDCTAAAGTWTSDCELKIDKNGFVIDNGKKTKDFWNGTIACNTKPLRMKIRNIAGDETIIQL